MTIQPTWSRLAQKTEKARSKYLKELRKGIFGPSKFVEYKRLASQERKKARKALELPHGPNLSPKDLRKAKKKKKRKARRFMEKRKIDVARLEKARKRSAEAIMTATGARLARNVSDRLPILASDTSPDTILGPALDPIVRAVFEPPFEDSGKWDHVNSVIFTDYTVDSEFLLPNPDTGEIWHQQGFIKEDAGDLDTAFVESDTGFQIPFQMPKTGRVDCLVKVTNLEGRHYCVLMDEFGFSDANVVQRTFIGMRINTGAQALETHKVRMFDMVVSGVTDGQWITHYPTPNGPYYVHFRSERSYSEDEWLNIGISSDFLHFIYSNDVSIASEMKFGWRIDQVCLHVY